MKIKVKRLTDTAKMPTYATDGSVGADLYADIHTPVTIDSGKTAVISTGISVEIPEGYVGLVYARSGLATKGGLAPANKVGVIDNDYRGEIKVALHMHSYKTGVVMPYDRIAQLVIAPCAKVEFEDAEELNGTLRDKGGFGSTGF